MKTSEQKKAPHVAPVLICFAVVTFILVAGMLTLISFGIFDDKNKGCMSYSVQLTTAPLTTEPQSRSPKDTGKLSWERNYLRGYADYLQPRIKSFWHAPDIAGPKPVKVAFTITNVGPYATNGTLSNLKVLTSSGSAVADSAALQAVKDAAPFNRLPALNSDNIDFEYIFDYSILKNPSRPGRGLR